LALADLPERETGLPPVIGPDPHILILGSFPSRMSLAAGLYYANPRNHFWPLMRTLITLEGGGIREWSDGLKANHVALWDIIASRAYQTGSRDCDIHDEEWNDIPAILDTYPTIRCICLNGRKAGQSFRQAMKGSPFHSPIVIHHLPSTSPANARYTLKEKTDRWRIMLQ